MLIDVSFIEPLTFISAAVAHASAVNSKPKEELDFHADNKIQKMARSMPQQLMLQYVTMIHIVDRSSF